MTGKKKKAAVAEWDIENEGPIRLIEGPYHLDEASFEGLVRRDVVFVVLFTVHWCTPCAQITPFVHQLATESRGNYFVGTVNVERCPKLAKDEEVRCVPTVVVYDNGFAKDRIVGANTSLPRIRKMVRDVLDQRGPKPEFKKTAKKTAKKPPAETFTLEEEPLA